MVPHDFASGQIRGRYDVFDEIACGGMGAVHLGRLVGPVGFARTVAIKRLHPHLARDPEFVASFLDEARLAARIRHPNVVPTLDVVLEDATVLVVMEYVHGQSLSTLARAAAARRQRIPPPIAATIIGSMLDGLHAAHEARDERGDLLELVHRDVSPQNVIVGADGIARMIDFGIAKATLRSEVTRDGHLKGKLRYMSPEQALGLRVDRRSDVFSAGIVLWELLTGEPLFGGESPIAVAAELRTKRILPPSTVMGDVPPALDAVVVRALDREQEHRFDSARAMAIAIEGAVHPVTAREIAEWVEVMAGDMLAERASAIAAIERQSAGTKGSVTGAAAEGAREPRTVATQAPPGSPPTDARRRRRRWQIGAGLGGGLAFVAVATLAGLGRRASPVTVEMGRAPDSLAPAAAASTVATEPVEAKGALPPPAVTTARPQGSAQRPSQRRTTHARTGGAQGSSCTPPYVIEANGVRRYKSECVD